MQVRLLGPLVVEGNGAQAALGGPQRRAVLALLVLAEGRAVSADTLIEALWGERPPATAANTLQVHVSALRKALVEVADEGETIERQGSGYRLTVSAMSLDHVRFAKLSGEGAELLARGDAGRALAVFAEALALWRGPALADFEYEAWAQAEAARLEDVRLSCLEGRVEAELASGRNSELVGELELLVGQYPQRERLAGQLMLALYRSGRQAEALEVYQQARQRLVEGLGIEPGPELQALNRRILNQDEALIGPARGEPGTVRLPVSPTPFVGRQRELADLTDLLGDDGVRLLTVVGPGGIGKTRLALAAAAAVADGFPDGVDWVPLHALRDSRLVSSTIAQAIEASSEPAAAIGERRMLLALDNFEQVVDAAGEVAALVSACPNLTVLVTSREPLHVAAEHEYLLSGLSEPDAAELFRERARAVRPDLESNGSVASICERLDRLPLALELAAARVNVLSLEGILEKLDDRLGVLTRGARDLPTRHQTLRQTIDWSYELLAEHEQRAFARLGVFVGGWTLEAAEDVCDVDIDALASLIDKSLVRRRVGEPVRYAMLEVIREYALERLDASERDLPTRRRQAQHFVDLAERAYPNMRGPETARWLNEIEDEHDNMRAALEFALGEGDTETSLRLAGALARFWVQRGHLSEGRRWLQAALAQPGHEGFRPRALRALALLDLEQGELEQPQVLAEEALALSRDHGDELESARAAGLLADVAFYRGEMEIAETRYGQAVVATRAAGDDLELAFNLHNLGDVCRLTGQLDRAEVNLEESLRLVTDLQDTFGQAISQHSLACVAEARGQRQRAFSLLTTATETLLSLRHVGGIAECLVLYGKLAANGGDPAAAARAWGAAAALGAEIGREQNPPVITGHEDAVGMARASLGVEEFERSWAEGEELDLEQAAALVLER